MIGDDLREARDGLDDAAGDLDRREGEAAECAPSVVVRTFAESAYPTAARKYYACHPAEVGGDEAEGADVVLTVNADVTVYVANLGAAVPPAGTYLIADAAGDRLAAIHD